VPPIVTGTTIHYIYIQYYNYCHHHHHHYHHYFHSKFEYYRPDLFPEFPFTFTNSRHDKLQLCEAEEGAVLSDRCACLRRPDTMYVSNWLHRIPPQLHNRTECATCT
jgi:hypothetical protein